MSQKIQMARAIPAGKYNLDDNMIIQRIAFWMTLAIWIFWLIATIASASAGVPGRDGISRMGIPAVNNDPNTGSQAGVVGNILFNFGFVTTVPSWINEKK